MNKKIWKYYGIALLAAVLDQALKLWVYYHMKMGALGQIKVVGNLFKLFYTLNPGMAFGIQFGFAYDKVLLTVIRVVATVFIIRYIWKLSLQEQAPKKLLWGWVLILGGAAGNGVDSIFYGKLLGNAPFGAPMTWFYGQVIDMLYVDLWSGSLPAWMPWIGGNMVTCLPIFNLADVFILAGVGLVIIEGNKHAQLLENTLESEEPANGAAENIA
jgi:signal peptidase II